MPKLVTRSELRTYMDVGASGTPSFTLMGEGFTSLSESKNPQEYSRKYVHENTERTDVVGYAPSIAYSVDVYTDSPVIKKIRDVTDQELVGADAQVDLVEAELFDAKSTDETTGEVTECPAKKRKFAIIPDAKADGTDALIYTGNLRAVGDVTTGKWNDKTKTFTEA